jgi:hypothetical protein
MLTVSLWKQDTEKIGVKQKWYGESDLQKSLKKSEYQKGGLYQYI